MNESVNDWLNDWICETMPMIYDMAALCQQSTGEEMTQLLPNNEKTKYAHLPLEALEVWLPEYDFSTPQVTILYRLASSILTAESWEVVGSNTWRVAINHHDQHLYGNYK